MPPSMPSALEDMELNNCIALILITAVVYEYILTLPREVDYVWFRQWTWVTLMYMIARYLGLFLVINYAFLTSSFIHDLAVQVSTAIFLASNWVTPVFFAASELVMILRVYAMWNRSWMILCVLLFTYTASIILAIVSASLYGSTSYTIDEVPDWSICNYSPNHSSTGFFPLTSIPVSILSIQLLVLAVSQTLKQSIGLYEETRRWQPNKYMKLFVRDGMLFFILCMLTFTAFIQYASSTPESTPMMLVQSFSYLYYGPFIPRLVINVRELSDREFCGPLAQGIDTGFGVLSQLDYHGNTAMSAIIFADDMGLEDSETEDDN